ncbi:extensin family protein [Rahnella perminowiae]|uniref:extensin-like domain-containing protein n=1 Tax=Rahnella perminowiae TaxID=2816244 RepID=UPI00215C48D4|nr:extensin family protein [Rahnella perminowiae]MCR9000803.1 extensin family protein [Rahnella perminowiae]
MRYWVSVIVIIIVAWCSGPWISRHVPSEYNPFSPVTINDPPNFITRYKLRKLDNNPQQCLAVLERARQEGAINFTRAGNTGGKCPLTDAVRVRGFGDVSLSSSYLASCRLALSSAMFVAQVAKPLAIQKLGSPLVRIHYLGSYACRNVYNQPDARLSEHATAQALDVAGFSLADGHHMTVLKQWPQSGAEGEYVRTLFSESCPYFGNSIGPEYNAAHANHFHLGMRWFGFCR